MPWGFFGRLSVALGVLGWAAAFAESPDNAAARRAREVLSVAGIKGGLVVHAGCGDGSLAAALGANKSFLVQALEADPANLAEARRRIRRLGWESPQDTDPNSTNCLLNGFACRVHQEQMGFHPYVMELAGLVREGYMSREEALARLGEEAAPEVMAAVMVKLGLVPALRGVNNG